MGERPLKQLPGELGRFIRGLARVRGGFLQAVLDRLEAAVGVLGVDKPLLELPCHGTAEFGRLGDC